MKKVIILCFFILVLPMSICSAQDTDPEILEYTVVVLVIERKSMEASASGLSENIIRKRVESQLRRNGMIKTGTLYVTVSYGKHACSIVVSYAPDYFQKLGVTYEKIGTVHRVGRNKTGACDPFKIYILIADLLDGVINEYIKANE